MQPPPDASNQSDSASQQRNCGPRVGQPSEPSMASAMVHEAPQNPVSLGDTCVDNLVAGDWLSFLPETVRKPVAGCGFYVLVAASAMLLFAPWADSRGEAYLNATFTRTLGALAATRGLAGQPLGGLRHEQQVAVAMVGCGVLVDGRRALAQGDLHNADVGLTADAGSHELNEFARGNFRVARHVPSCSPHDGASK